MAGFQRRLRSRPRRRATARRPLRLPFIHGEAPASMLSAVLSASRHGVVVQEGERFYLVTRDRGLRIVSASDSAGALARAIGREIVSAEGAVDDAPAESRGLRTGRGMPDLDGPGIGEAVLSDTLEMVAANHRAPVAVVICSRNPRHVYNAARRLKLCPRDGAPFIRLEPE